MTVSRQKFLDSLLLDLKDTSDPVLFEVTQEMYDRFEQMSDEEWERRETLLQEEMTKLQNIFGE